MPLGESPDWLAEMYVMGVSTRKVTEITEQLCGTEISEPGLKNSKLLDETRAVFGQLSSVYLATRRSVVQDVAVLKATDHAGASEVRWGQLPTQ